MTVAGCGLTADDEPRVLSERDVAPLLPSSTTSTAPAETNGVDVTVYFLNEQNRLTPVERTVPARTPGEVLDALLTMRPSEEEQQDGLSSAIPTPTELRGVQYDETTGLVTVDVAATDGGLFSLQATEQLRAFAQIVWTLTDLRDVNGVVFQLEGETTAVQATQESSNATVTREHYTDPDLVPLGNG